MLAGVACASLGARGEASRPTRAVGLTRVLWAGSRGRAVEGWQLGVSHVVALSESSPSWRLALRWIPDAIERIESGCRTTTTPEVLGASWAIGVLGVAGVCGVDGGEVTGTLAALLTRVKGIASGAVRRQTSSLVVLVLRITVVRGTGRITFALSEDGASLSFLLGTGLLPIPADCNTRGATLAGEPERFTSDSAFGSPLLLLLLTPSTIRGAEALLPGFTRLNPLMRLSRRKMGTEHELLLFDLGMDERSSLVQGDANLSDMHGWFFRRTILR